MARAWEAYNVGNIALARKVLENHFPTNVASLDSKSSQLAGELPGWEWRYLWGQTRSDALVTLCQETNEIRSLSVSSDGNVRSRS